MTMYVPQIFVGTMYCGEGDYSECVQKVLDQRGVAVQHITVANQPEKDAHNRLWTAWRGVQNSGFDMFVKLDADTVLSHNEVLLDLWTLMNSNKRITGIQAPLLDYFTDGYINGLNCFSPRVTFRDTADTLFCDRQVDVDHDVVVRSQDVPNSLRPAGFHCYHATDVQAFHFGLHRALKNQKSVIESTYRAWKKNSDRTRVMALLGADVAQTFGNVGFNYDDELFKTTFATTEKRYDEFVNKLVSNISFYQGRK